MNLRPRFILLLIGISMLCSLRLGAQVPINFAVRPTFPPDSTDVVDAEKKHFWRAAGEIFVFNNLLWLRDRIWRSDDPSFHISWNTMKRNLKSGFKWDNDHLISNTFAHPYSGSLYYNAARSSGFNYWQSGLFTLSGSLMWEVFMESEYPALNDVICTTVGGLSFGEVLYRTSDAVLDNRTTGGERVVRETAAFILGPMRGLNRLFTGKLWRHSATSGRQFGMPDLALQVSLGPSMLIYGKRWKYKKASLAMRLDMEYGDRFEVKSKRPYDYFTMRAELNLAGPEPLVGRMNIEGRLIGHEFLEKDDKHLSLGLYQHFDYYDSDTIKELNRVPYKLGIPASVGAGLLFRDIDRYGWVTDAYLHTNAVILGGVLSDHYYVGNRCYNWASGFSIKAGINGVYKKDRFSISLRHEFYRLFTWDGYKPGTDLRAQNHHTFSVMGDKSQSSFHVSELLADFRITKHLYATFVLNNYFRHTHYNHIYNPDPANPAYPRVDSNSFAMRLMATYKF